MSKRNSIYYHNGRYARENGELEQYRASHKANIECRIAIERAIAKNFDGMHLDSKALDEVLEQHTIGRIAMVLAVTVSVKEWDERFSRSNKAWAACVKMPEGSDDPMFDRRADYAVTTHPAVLNGFIDIVRKATTAPV